LKDEKFYIDLKDESKKEFDSLKNELLDLVEDYSSKFNRNRGFEIVSDSFRKFSNQEIQMPTRGSEHSAGYDFYSNETVDILPGGKYLFWTDIRAYMNVDEVLEIYPRSSIGIKKDLALANTTGIIDMDYYQNPDNDGIIGVCLRNLSTNIVKIEKG
jgi:dUTP pyrophosphatase